MSDTRREEENIGPSVDRFKGVCPQTHAKLHFNPPPCPSTTRTQSLWFFFLLLSYLYSYFSLLREAVCSLFNAVIKCSDLTPQGERLLNPELLKRGGETPWKVRTILLHPRGPIRSVAARLAGWLQREASSRCEG